MDPTHPHKKERIIYLKSYELRLKWKLFKFLFYIFILTSNSKFYLMYEKKKFCTPLRKQHIGSPHLEKRSFSSRFDLHLKIWRNAVFPYLPVLFHLFMYWRSLIPIKINDTELLLVDREHRQQYIIWKDNKKLRTQKDSIRKWYNLYNR